MAEQIDKATSNRQELYDLYHNEINTVYALVKEGINTDRRGELSSLEQHNRGKAIPNVEQEKEQIVDKYKELDEENLRNCGELKGELRSLVNREGLELRGVDETSEDAVTVYEESLKYVKKEEDNESVASLETHDPLDQTSSNRKAENREGPSKTSDTGKTPTNKGENNEGDSSIDKKRSRDVDSNEEESSKKRLTQKESDESKGLEGSQRESQEKKNKVL